MHPYFPFGLRLSQNDEDAPLSEWILMRNFRLFSEDVYTYIEREQTEIANKK